MVAYPTYRKASSELHRAQAAARFCLEVKVSMNFQQCRYAQAIAEMGSFSQAAKKLFVTQPNLSASIKDLEEELGVHSSFGPIQVPA